MPSMTIKSLTRIACQALWIGAFSFASIEVSLQLLLRTNTLKLHGVLQHPNISREEFKEYLEARNELTGWPSALAHGTLFNSDGYRPSPENDKWRDTNQCVSVFGDSQGYGLDVPDSDAWTNVLARQLECRVANYSVPAYGTDQALLRYEQVNTSSDLAILTFIDDDIRRNLIQYWDLAYGPIYIERTKPRFILSNNESLKLVPLPINTFKEAESLNNWLFGDLLKYETFLPNSPLYKTAFQPSFPFSYALIKNALVQYSTRNSGSYLVKSTFLTRLVDKRLDPIKAINNKESLSLQAAILSRFLDRCRERQQKCLIARLNPNFQNPQQESNSPVSSFLESDARLSKHLISSKYLATCINTKLIRDWKLQGNIDIRMPGGHYGKETNDALASCIANIAQQRLGNK